MNTKNKNKSEQTAHLFNVDILIEEQSNALAAERLLQLLNQCGFSDYRVKSGIELGKLIDALESQAQQAKASSKPAEQAPKTVPPPAPASAPVETAATGAATLVIDRIKTGIAENRLVRLSVNKGFGVRLNIPCRIINFDESSQMITVYHVDEKQVYAFTLNEIDDFLF